MAWIDIVAPDKAAGLLKQIYDSAIRRAGRVYHIISIQSLRPKVLRSSIRTYLEIMHSPESGLTRAQREMIATTVSQVNDCHY